MSRPHLDAVKLSLAGEMGLDCRQNTLSIVRMHPRAPFVIAILDFVIPVAEHRLPAGRIVDDVGGEVPVPDTVVGATNGKLKALLALAELLLQRIRYVVCHGENPSDRLGVYDREEIVGPIVSHVKVK
jgi:hypothetical protein